MKLFMVFRGESQVGPIREWHHLLSRDGIKQTTDSNEASTEVLSVLLSLQQGDAIAARLLDSWNL